MRTCDSLATFHNTGFSRCILEHVRCTSHLNCKKKLAMQLNPGAALNRWRWSSKKGNFMARCIASNCVQKGLEAAVSPYSHNQHKLDGSIPADAEVFSASVLRSMHITVRALMPTNYHVPLLRLEHGDVLWSSTTAPPLCYHIE
jgi:hypothetical protein